MAHKSEAAILTELQKAAQAIEVGATYAHYKDQTKTYKVEGFLVIEATDEIGVVYRANYGATLGFVRPVSVWLESVNWQGKRQPRFKKIA